MPLDEIQPGMKGTGRTVFTGNQIEDFDVEILGVMRNVAPRQSIILARLSGGPLERTGVLAGMSGSPVYINGKLIGAVAMTFQFIKDPIAGITPIQQMLGPEADTMLASDPAPRQPVKYAAVPQSGELRLLATDLPDPLAGLQPATMPVFLGGAETSMTRVATPLNLSGFTSQAIEYFQPQLKALGLVPMQGGGAGTDNSQGPGKPPVPGSMISVQLVRGDMGASADGTVTLVDGKKIYAFGHPFLAAGPTEIPFGESQVIASVSSYANSMKITTPGKLLGVIQSDGSSGIVGTLGGQARMIPVELEITPKSGAPQSYHFEVANDRFLLPFLMNMTMFSAIGTTERQVGDATLQVEQSISLDGLPEIKLENFISGNANGPAMVARAVAAPLSYLLQGGVGPLDLRGIKVKVQSSNQRRSQELEQVWTSRREVKPGDKVEITAVMRDQDGNETVQKAQVEIPANAPEGPLTISVADGATMDRIEAGQGGRTLVPRNPQQLVRAFNKARRNNRLYVRLAVPATGFTLQGDDFPSPPPSVVSTLSADPSLSTNVARTMVSTVAEYELDPAPGVVSGYKVLSVNVEN